MLFHYTRLSHNTAVETCDCSICIVCVLYSDYWLTDVGRGHLIEPFVFLCRPGAVLRSSLPTFNVQIVLTGHFNYLKRYI